MKTMGKWVLSAAALSCVALASAHAEDIKIGFLVKAPEQQWFQEEWKYAEQAAKEKGFKLIKIGVPSDDKVLSAIDNLAAQHAQGFIICAPDVKLGPAIVSRAKQTNMKLLSVDDRLVDGKDMPIESVPHVGISAFKIGEEVGNVIAAEIKHRGWNPAEVGAIRVTYDQMQTTKERTDGTTAALLAAGFPEANIFSTALARNDTESAVNAANIALTQHPKFKYWTAFSVNDEAVLGAVRATEGRGIKAENVAAVGMGGTKAAVDEFLKPKPTGFYATVLVSPKPHGYNTAIAMYDWIKDGKEPPKLTLTKPEQSITRDNAVEIRKQRGL